MEMKRIAFVALLVAASMSAVLAAVDTSPSPSPASTAGATGTATGTITSTSTSTSTSPSPSPSLDGSAPAPSPTASNAIAALPSLAYLIGASFLPFFAVYRH